MVFRSKVISDMLVVLFIGGLGLFPNNIFLLSAYTTNNLKRLQTAILSKSLERERERQRARGGEAKVGKIKKSQKLRSESGPLVVAVLNGD
ncbi:hypothetical protein C1H46_045395 [Malus baccata]|uniref:Uncharacterized protein n=1 Tax=Malus baccata TaxID=106549 RepID=A0A540K5B2_MALBA|nr:hypothetical protein C1H46_045395 [Malus baccata]